LTRHREALEPADVERVQELLDEVLAEHHTQRRSGSSPLARLIA
jgi:hypothetical protein